MWSLVAVAISLVYVGRAATYNQKNAINALYYAYGAYCDADELSSWSCKWCEYVKNFEIGGVITGESLQAFIGYDPDYGRVVISFRGTSNVEDWIDDFDYTQMEYSLVASQGISNPYVHKGFYDAWNELGADGLTSKITTMFKSYPGSSILITGHSLGAAVAQIAAIELKLSSYSIGAVSVITFGSPRWCDETLATYYDGLIDSNWRIVNEDDIVPTLPYTYMGSYDYHHTATEVRYTNYNTLTYEQCNGSGEDDSCLYIGYSVPDHLHYFGLYEDCSSSSSIFIDEDYLNDLSIPSTTDDCPCDDGISSTESMSGESDEISSTNVVDSNDNDDDESKIIYKFKEGLDNVSKITLSIAVAIGWLLAFIFCCCWCKTRRDLINGQRKDSYFPIHQV